MHSYIIKITESDVRPDNIYLAEGSTWSIREKTGSDSVDYVGESGYEEAKQLVQRITGGTYDGAAITISRHDVIDKLDEIALSASESLKDWVYSRSKGTCHFDDALGALSPDRGVCFIMPERAPMNRTEFLIMLYDRMEREKKDEVVLNYAGALDYHA